MSMWIENKPAPWSRLGVVVVLAAIVGFFVARRGMGFTLVLVVPIVAAWAAWALYASRGWQERRRQTWRKIGVWAIALGGAGALHWHYSVDARDIGDAIVRGVTQYQAATGRYPDSLAQAGIDPSLAKRGRAVYFLDAHGLPRLVYVSTFEIMSSHSYDFQARRWEFNPD